MRTKAQFQCLCGCLLVLLCAGTATAQDRLLLGIFPYLDPGTLVRLHSPLKQHLEQALGGALQMRSAADFKSFKQQTAAGGFDILLTAPHLGRLADTQAGYRWVGFTRNRSHAVFVVQQQSAYSKLADLRGRTIALPPKSAIIHQMALRRLRADGVQPGVDVTIDATSSHNNALISVIRGVNPAAAFGKPTWDLHIARGAPSLRKITESEDIPGFALLVHPRVAEKDFVRIREAAFDFVNTGAGEAYFQATGLAGFRAPAKADLSQLDSFLEAIQKARKEP